MAVARLSQNSMPARRCWLHIRCAKKPRRSATRSSHCSRLTQRALCEPQVRSVKTLPAEVDIDSGATPSFTKAGSSWLTTIPSDYAASGKHMLFSVATYELTEDFTPLPGG